VDSYLIHKNLTYLREKREGMLGKKKPTQFHALAYPDSAQVKKLDVKVKPSNIQSYLSKKDRASNLYLFYDNIRLAHTQDTARRNTTWVELYILAVHRGFYQVPVKARATAKGTSAAKAIAAFKADSRDILKRILIGSNDEHVFKPAKHTRGILQGLAIEGQYPAISGAIYMDQDEQCIIQKAIIHLSRKVLKITVDKFIQGNYNLMPTPLKYNGRHEWASTIPVDNKDLPCLQEGLAATDLTQASFLICPNDVCSKVMYSTHKGFDASNVDTTLKCIHCKKNYPNGRWECKCRTPWPTCPHHANGVPPKAPIAPKRRAKKNRDSAMPSAGQRPKTHRQLVAQDLAIADNRRSKRPATSTVVDDNVQTSDLVKRIKFGPTIAARFCRPSSSGSRTG